MCFYLNIKWCVDQQAYFDFLLLQENPSEEDAAIVDKVLSLRLTKKEVCLFYLIPIQLNSI